MIAHHGRSSERQLLAATASASAQEQVSLVQSITAALRYPLLEMTITPGGLILAALLSLVFIEISYRIRAACSRKRRIRRILVQTREIDGADGVFEEASYYRRQQSQLQSQRRCSRGGWLRGLMGRLFSRQRKSMDGFNDNYGNEAGLFGGDKTPPPPYEDYAAHVSDGYCGGNYAHTPWPDFEADIRDEKVQQQQEEEEEEDEEVKNEKAVVVDEQDNARAEQEQEAEGKGGEEQEEQENNEVEEEEEEGEEEEDLMSMSQEIASFRSVADMVSEIVAAAAADERR